MGPSVFTMVGFIGVVMVLVAYFANQQRWLSSEDWRFPFANFFGSCLLLVSLYQDWNLPSAIINLAWAAISLWGMVKGMRARMVGASRER
jgi:paired small multidrug resistance pump